MRVLAAILLAGFSCACSSRSLGVGTATPGANDAGSVPSGTNTGGVISTPTPGPSSSGGAWTDGSTVGGGATVDSTSHTLTANADGTLTSKVFDRTDPNTQYKTDVATSTRPYNIPLPDMKGQDAGAFLTGKLDMTQLGNLGLYHLGSLSGTQVMDTSGNGHVGTCTNCVMSSGRGLFDSPALVFNGTGVAKFGKGASAATVTGAGAFTVTFWMNSSTPTGGPGSKGGFIYGQRDVNDSLNGEWEIGLNVGAPNGTSAVAGQLHFWIWNGGNVAEIQSTGGAAGTGWADGQWHQVVAVRDVAAGNNVMALYIDGQLNAISMNEPNLNPSALATCLGAECNGGGQDNYFNGMIQELGVFNTAWTQTTAADAYLRGNPNFKFQIRACNDPSCAGSTGYVGPDGSANSYFYPTSRATGGSLAIMQNGATSFLGGRYFQFKVSAKPFSYTNAGQPVTPPFSLTNLTFNSL